MMETPVGPIESLLGRVETYSKTSLELAKLKSLETTTHVATSLISRMSVLILFALFVLVFTIGIALWLGELLGHSYYGFFIVAGFYLLVGIIFQLFLHKWINKPVGDLIITQALQ